MTNRPRDPEGSASVHPPPAVLNVRETLKEIYPSLTHAELQELLQNLRRSLQDRYGLPESILTTTIESVPPAVANQIRSSTDPWTYIERLEFTLSLILILWQLLGHAPSVTEITQRITEFAQIFNIEINIGTTNVTNLPPPLPNPEPPLPNLEPPDKNPEPPLPNPEPPETNK
jgi:hypothetical protein